MTFPARPVQTTPNPRPPNKRWYAPLLRSTQPDLAVIQQSLGDDERPLALLGAAWVHRLCTVFGTHTSRKMRLAAMLFQELCSGDFQRELPATWHTVIRQPQTASALTELFRHAHQQSQAQLDTLFSSITDPERGLGDRDISGAALFFRLGVGLAAISNQINLRQLADLQDLATCFGLAIDYPMLTEQQISGTLATLNNAHFGQSIGNRTLDLTAFHALKNPEFLAEIQTSFERFRHSDPLPVTFRAWEPVILPPTQARRQPEHNHLQNYFESVAPELDAALNAWTASPSEAITSVLESLHIRGGKRIRPLLVLLSAEACNGAARQAMKGAAAVEWIHQISLVLDDIMDNATLRRGAPTIHIQGNLSVAVGSSLFLLARLHQVLREHPELPDTEFLETAIDMARGQWLEWCHTGDVHLSPDTLTKIHDLKTARLFVCAVEVGAALSGATSTQREALVEYARELGLAFQEMDDLLDICGATIALGKRVGTDIRARKLTAPILRLLPSLTPTERERLIRLYDVDATPLAHDIHWVQERLREHHIAAQCHELIHRRLARALKALQALPASPARDHLKTLAMALSERTR